MTNSDVQQCCETLVARGALTYAPSLAWAVQDALYSYCRLPPPAKQELAVLAPRICVVTRDSRLTVDVDWAAFAANFEPDGAVSGVHGAWALALNAEAVLDSQLLPKLPHKPPLSTDNAIAHHDTVRKLLALLSPADGEYYMGFLILITVLEKALYDLHSDHQRHHGESAKTAKKNMILRDLLHSDALRDALPRGLLQLLKILFLPSGLNLRNLAWHGFIVPAELPRCFALLTAALVLDIPQYFLHTSTATTSSFFSLSSFNDRFHLPAAITGSFHSSLSQVSTLCLTAPSAFIPRGREQLVHRAVHKLATTSDELWFLCAMLPVLEHALRLQFVQQNQRQYPLLALSDFARAQIDQYYSTLDGFGQRDKHQVLLHSDVAMATNRTRNALYATLPCAAIAVCLDLFMMADGPNARAKLCHGEADLSTLLAPDGTVSTITQLVLLAWTSLCHSAIQSQLPLALELFQCHVRSSFHPFTQLSRLVEACDSQLTAFDALRATWSHCHIAAISGSPPDTGRLDFTVGGLSVTDKRDRLEELLQLASGSVARVARPTTFSQLVAALGDQLAIVHRQLSDHNSHFHSGESGAVEDRALLALGDADGLSVSACMLEILGSVHRSLTSLAGRVEALAKLIRHGTARTNHRRSFLNTVSLLPVFGDVQRLALGLVKHQVELLRRRAGGDHAECPRAEKMEQLQRKVLQFITAFEGCTGSAEGAQKSADKALQLAIQFLDSKALRTAVE